MTTASLRVITRRDRSQVVGQVLKVVPQEPVTVCTTSRGGVVSAWDDIRRIEDLQRGPARSPEPVYLRPFQAFHIDPPPGLRSTISEPRHRIRLQRDCAVLALQQAFDEE